MSRPSVVMFTCYPLKTPRHGGQIRARALVDTYQRNGFSVWPLAVYENGAFQAEAVGPLDVAFPADDRRWFVNGRNMVGTSDIRSGDFAASSEGAYEKIRQSLPSRVDVFHLEQPWLLPLVKRLKQEPRFAQSLVVYGSQNIETPLRETMFKSLKVTDGAGVVAHVAELEREACRFANLSLAVVHDDLSTLIRFGAQRVMHAPNGITSWQGSPELVAEWQVRLRARRIALFVGSAHAPNIDGFFSGLGESMGFVPPDCKIVIGGAVGPHIQRQLEQGRYSVLNQSRVEVTGEITDEQLAALKTLTSVFLLPIFDGGGSNIKTAEAIYSRKRVVATGIALRGYEGFIANPEIVRADTREAFRDAVHHALLPTTPSLAPIATDARREKLLWEQCLSEVPLAVKNLVPS